IAIVLMLSLGGCATRSQICPEPTLPAMPALTEPIPLVSYSLNVQQSLSKWEASLIGTPQTP
ncbi:hypothetical protein, partial [Caballeronia sp. ATUFL_F1_KS4A]|uniref:hypothetical protein n=1 Tax=Caballeronia sp. ATUFL_F1_KS4A TaxID=2921768 RepID=UPI002027D24E